MPAVKPKSVQVDLALSSLDVEVDVKDALYFLQGPPSRINPKSPTKVNSADFFTFILMLIPVSNVAFAVPPTSFFQWWKIHTFIGK